jgi:hypothetical protein
MATTELSVKEEAGRYLYLLEEVIALACRDFNGLKKMSAITNENTVNGFFWSRRSSGGYRKPKFIQCESEAEYLLDFLQGKSLDNLCSYLPTSSRYAFPCRIRKKLGLPQRSDS